MICERRIAFWALLWIYRELKRYKTPHDIIWASDVGNKLIVDYFAVSLILSYSFLISGKSCFQSTSLFHLLRILNCFFFFYRWNHSQLEWVHGDVLSRCRKKHWSWYSRHGIDPKTWCASWWKPIRGIFFSDSVIIGENHVACMEFYTEASILHHGLVQETNVWINVCSNYLCTKVWRCLFISN